MFKHKAFELLKSLSPDEFVRLGDFIASPYFTRSKNVLTIYKYIYRYYPEFSSENLAKQKIYKNVFRSSNYKDSSVRNVMAKLLKATETFLVMEKIGHDKLYHNNLLLEELLRRNHHELFLKNLRETELMLQNITEVDFDYLLNRYKLERNKFNFSQVNDRIISKSKVYSHIKNLGDSGIYLSIYYVTEIISENINIILYEEKFNAEEKLRNTIGLILNCIDLVNISTAISGNNECAFMLEIYTAMLHAFRELDNDENYRTYKNLVVKNIPRLSHDELSYQYQTLASCCILKVKQKKFSEKDSRELLSLYTEILEKEYYKNKKEQYMPVGLYRDILFHKNRINRLDLIGPFIENFSGKIRPGERENMYNFSNAFYYYYLKEFGTSLEYINKIKLDYFIYKYDIKNLLLKVYYELGYYEEAISLIHTYRELLRKDVFLTEGRKTRFRNFIKYLRRLIILKIGSNIKGIEDLKEELVVQPEISYEKWLMEKTGQVLSVKGAY